MQVSRLFNKTFLLIILTSIPFSCIGASKHKGKLFKNYNFYYGFDAGALQAQFQDRYGADFFGNAYLDFNIFFGARKNKALGFELGFSTTTEDEHYRLLKAGEYFPGTIVPLPGWQSWTTTFKTRNFYLGINYYAFLTRKTSIYALASGEITYMDIHMVRDSSYLPGSSTYKVHRTFSKTQLIPSVKAGINYDITSGWGIRLYYAWRYYELFNPMKSKEFPNRQAELRLNNSNSWYFGTYLIF